MIGARILEPPPRATLRLLPEPEHGPIVTPIDWAAGDRAIAQYFWTSTDKDGDAWTCPDADVERVIRFGMKAQPVPHGTPSGHGHLTVLVERIDLATAEQMLRHRVQVQSPDGDGTGWITLEWAPNASKKSHRYVKAGDEAYLPRPEHVRGQTGRPGAYTFEILPREAAERGIARLEALYEHAFETYGLLVDEDGWAPELARVSLSVGTYTRMYLTASYRNWCNWLLQRHDAHAQLEVRMVAEQVEQIIAQCIPITYGLWIENGRRTI